MSLQSARASVQQNYTKATVYLLSTVLVLTVVYFFVLPGRKLVWENPASADDANNLFIISSIISLQYVFLVAIGLVGIYGLLEWRNAGWRRNRRLILQIIFYLLTAATIIFFISVFAYGCLALLHL